MPDRSSLVESLAATYAAAVVDVLADEFPALTDNSLGRIVPEDIARQAEAPMRSFELIVTYTREWRLVPDRSGAARWRVQVACFSDEPTAADLQREERLNAALRAIQPWKKP